MAQNNRVAFTTDVGKAQYPWLNKPDSAFGGEPKYKTNLVMENSKAIIKLIVDAARQEFGDKADKARMPFDLDEDTGECILKVKSKYAPAFFDATGQEIFGGQIPQLFGGSVIRVGGYASPYTVSGTSGVSLQLTRVQIITPVSSSQGGGADATGFNSVEGGFTANDLMEAQTEEINDEVEQAPATSADRF